VDETLARQRIAFVFFTADWCLTCKVNEKLVLGSDRVQAELARLDVAVFRADWTRRDEGIRTELARLGRAGVPTYAIHHPGRGSPVVLPELLTPGRLVAALRGEGAHVVAEQE
jgi:thiol:disulfide interchange protein DsbD